jgi:hypothetical protein
LITGDFGNKPISDRDWPEGTLEIANHSSRLGWWEGPPFGGGQYTFLFRGDAKALNEALEALARIKAPAVELHVRQGPQDSFWLRERDDGNPQAGKADAKNEKAKKGRDPRIDWSFTVWTPRNFHHLYNNPRSLFSSDRPEFRKAVPAPRIDVYIGGGLIDWKDVKVPEKVRVIGPSGDTIDKASVARVRLHVYDMLTSKPVKNARLKLVSYGDEGMKDVAQTTTDEDGSAAFADLPPGTYDVRIEADGYAPRSLGWQPYERGDDKTVSTELSPLETIAGRVINSKDQPIAGAKVHTFVLLGIDGRGYAMPERAETTTGADGRFELKLPAGYTQLTIYADGYYFPFTEVLSVPSKEHAFTMVQSTTVTVKLTDKDGNPVAGKSIYLEPVGTREGKWSGSATSDDQGVATLQGVPPGEYTIAESPASDGGKRLRIEEGKPQEVQVTR